MVPLSRNLVGGVPLCEAGNVVLNLRIQALMKFEDNVCALEVTHLVHGFFESVDILVDRA
jgi:hypothetical protein